MIISSCHDFAFSQSWWILIVTDVNTSAYSFFQRASCCFQADRKKNTTHTLPGNLVKSVWLLQPCWSLFKKLCIRWSEAETRVFINYGKSHHWWKCLCFKCVCVYRGQVGQDTALNHSIERDTHSPLVKSFISDLRLVKVRIGIRANGNYIWKTKASNEKRACVKPMTCHMMSH